MNKKNYSPKELDKRWHIKILLQGALVGFIYACFITVGFIYATLGMSPRYANILVFIINIPVYPVDISREVCCSLYSLREQHEMIRTINIIFAWLVFYICALIFKIDIKISKLTYLSIIIGIVYLMFIDLLSFVLS